MHEKELKTLREQLEEAINNLYHLEFTHDGLTKVVEHPIVKDLEEIIKKIEK